MNDYRILGLVAALAREVGTRLHAALDLARQLEADDLLILTFEKEHAVYLPPCGFPQTLFNSRRWKAFIREISAKNIYETNLCYPTADFLRKAKGWLAPDRGILVLFDGSPNEELVRSTLCLLPLITPTFEKERLLISLAAKAKLSAQSAQQARELAEALDAVRRQLQSTVILREQDIAERERVEKELEKSNLDLKRVNDDLNQFTFAATHDIREPLRMMTIYVQLLQRDLQGQLSGNATEYIENVVNGAQRISRLIDGLLQFTRLGGSESLKPIRVDAGVALEEALEDLRMSIAETDATVMHSPLPVVLAEPTHLRQLFQNLIGNSIKYRRPELKPQIQVCSHRDGDHWRFTIRDNGIGVASEHHDQIFLPFKRLHGSEITGAGIGLATCKRIVERYGGRIWVSSEEHRGAEFSFTLPDARGEQVVE